ncbi:kinetochore scaffold 1 [Megalops cyprinoides]|uniref:kinetochore scaffold 1 n=1 Tax=Megalops cyprinoides TaxID=118141 RepID=UPI001863F4CD|nr:kinetochore scaffold 1 [Megalops cyprinoides]
MTSSSPKTEEAAAADSLTTAGCGIENPGGSGDVETSSDKPENSRGDQQINVTEPINLLKSKPWAARLSVGGFLPKLPRRSKPLDPNQEDLAGLSSFGKVLRKARVSAPQKDGDVENIEEEVLADISDDLSELDEGDFPGESHDQEHNLEDSLGQTAVEETFAQPVQNVAQGQKRPSPVDGHEDDMGVERKMRSPSALSEELEPPMYAVQWDSNVMGMARENTHNFMTKTSDSTSFSNSSANQRCDGTFETSVHRSSQYDFQFEEPYNLHLQKKLEDGSITVREFLRLFGIDFNIHKPRQSVLPDKFATDLPRSAEVILMEKHISQPKQRVYEEDCQELTEMVERLKTRMRDQDNTLKATNESLWEVVKSYSEEQLQSFGANLRKSKTHFRKKSKALSHEMKTGLYSKLVHATQVAQHNLAEKIEAVDELLKNLDECIHDLEAELASMDCAEVEEGGTKSETELALQAKQQELESLNADIAENERRSYELELEKKATEDKLRKACDKTRELERQAEVLDRLTEWKLGEMTDDKAVFTFLYESLRLEVLFEKPTGETMAATETDQKVADITFQLELDDETSECYARMVHKLIAQFIKSKSSWVQMYPTKQHIPMLLHNVSLVVSRLRLLGEEIHRMKKWGSLSLDILEIDCVDTQIRFLFSSINAFAKFEITLEVTSGYPFSNIQLLCFQNFIGNTRIDQVEAIVSSVTPAKSYLTRIVKKIHDVLLC